MGMVVVVVVVGFVFMFNSGGCWLAERRVLDAVNKERLVSSASIDEVMMTSIQGRVHVQHYSDLSKSVVDLLRWIIWLQ